MNALEEMRSHCMAKPGATEDYPWGDIVWKVGGKMFAGTGGDGEKLGVKSTLDKQAALIQHPDIEVAQYVGKHGWVTLRVNAGRLNWKEIAELLAGSYRLVASTVRGRAKR